MASENYVSRAFLLIRQGLNPNPKMQDISLAQGYDLTERQIVGTGVPRKDEVLNTMPCA